MNKEEFLQELSEALAGDVPESVIRDNISYYSSYLTQEMAKGRTVDEIVREIGEPFILAKTIIEHCEASGECSGDDGSKGHSYGDSGRGYSDSGRGYEQEGQQSPFSNMRYIDLNKWYWKLAAVLVLFFVVSLVFRIIGGILALLFRFAGPILMIYLIIWFLKKMKR